MESLDDYQRRVLHYKGICQDYPFIVSIETLATCNARCDFCPYVQIERKGTELPTELFYKIIEEMKTWPKHHVVSMTLSRVNEPFIDTRIWEFYEAISRELPQNRIFLFSNGQPLNARNRERLCQLKNVDWMVISLNEHRPDKYYEVMGLDFAKTLANLEGLYNLQVSGELYFPLTLTRVGDGTKDDDAFLAWCAERFPAFRASVAPRGDWMGAVETTTSPVPDVGCAQWYQVHILANGKDSFCCIDSEGKFGMGLNIVTSSLIDIYHHPARRFARLEATKRSHVEQCKVCSMMA